MQRPPGNATNKSADQNTDLDLVIKELNQFKGFRETEMICAYIIEQVNQFTLGTVSSEHLAALSEKIIRWSNDDSLKHIITKDKLSFSQVLKNTLARLPINVEDFSTLENIPSEFRLMTSDRYQFDIRSLVRWLNEKKMYVHPYTRKLFTAEDQKNIQAFADQKNQIINFSAKVVHQEDDPSLLRNAVRQVLARDDGAGVNVPWRHARLFQPELPPDPNTNTIPIENLERMRPIIFLPNDEVILARQVNESWVSKYYVYRRATGEYLRSFGEDNQHIDDMVLLTNGNIVVGSSNSDHEIRMYNPNNGTLVRRMSQHGDKALSLTALPNGNFAALGNKLLRIYNSANGELLNQFPLPARASHAGYQSILLRNGNIAYICDAFDDSIQIINPSNGNSVKIGRGNVLLITELPNGELGVMTGRGNNVETIQIYNQDNGELLREFYNQNAGIYNPGQLSEKCLQLMASPSRNSERKISLEFSVQMNQAIKILTENGIFNETNESVIKYYPRYAVQLANGLVILDKAGILIPENIDVLKNYDKTQFADQIAQAMVLLSEKNILNTNNRKVLKDIEVNQYTRQICMVKLAEALIILNEHRIANPENISLLNRPYSVMHAPQIAKGLVYLTQAGICNDQNRHSITFSGGEFADRAANAFVILSQAQILNSITIDKVKFHPEFSETIANGIIILQKENLLNEKNIDHMLSGSHIRDGKYADKIARGMILLNEAGILNDDNVWKLAVNVSKIDETVGQLIEANRNTQSIRPKNIGP